MQQVRKILKVVPDLSVSDVALVFHVTQDTVRRWIKLGRFPNAYKSSFSRFWFIPRSDVERLLGRDLSLPF